MIRVAFRTCALLAAMLAAACGGSTTSPSTTAATTSSSATTEYFTGTLSPRTAQFYSFTVTVAGPVGLTLISTSTAKIGPVVPVRLDMGIGVPSGDGCATTSSVPATPGLGAQLTNMTGTGTYCVNLADSGGLNGDVLFVVRVTHS